MSDDRIDPLYAANELARTLRAAAAHGDPAFRTRAETRARSWLAVLQNLASEALRAGWRQPYADTPVWVTLDVLRGGFASGAHSAGGVLQAHELDAAAALGVVPTRGALHAHALSPSGLEALAAKLRDRDYRITVPEEGALLVARWLIDRGEHESAAALIETIAPWFDRLRFYPAPGAPLPVPEVGLSTPVLPRSAHDVARALRRKTPSEAVETMREAVEIWAPLTDALVSLVLETVTGDPPRLVDGKLTGGRPFTRAPERFEERREALLAEITRARKQHTICKRIHHRSEVFETMREALAADEQMRGWLVSRVAFRLAGFVTAHGVPGSEQHTRMRAAQRLGPSHAHVGFVLADRLERSTQPGDGLDDPEASLHPIVDAEATASVPLGTAMPRRARELVSHAHAAPLPTLVERGVVSSGETLAKLLPQLVGPALATRFDDPRARTLYAASYRAFRQRRSLLLLWLQHQVRFGELPWIAALESCADHTPEQAVREMLRALAAFAITSFPDTITPNKLVSELTALAAQGGLAAELPLVEEVASDIFMGTFSIKFLRAAQIAARVLGSSSLYARYYGIDYERVLGFEQVAEKWSVKIAPELAAYCRERGESRDEGSNPRAVNGTIIEQASILTTHNLAALVSVLDLRPLLDAQWLTLARRAYVSVLDRLERRVLPDRVPTRQRMRASKTLAFAWRQMLFFLSMAVPTELDAFLREATELLEARTPLARERFAPVLAGLRDVVSGGHTRPLLGWTVERPMLMGPRSAAR